ncbi:hypothetical protein F0919_14170 [Taibaiella lutea]|uniref:DUF4302 domain-containing protein n=1 Tax=Taibaiella lutea TaxID=2608001 RepID=A0A5M6CKM3_9BACT|nr:hypothetical protein [Taibaiella lutea]KAA5533679.1 hypothetical protein F0919_14170 [Taibaiella lutea]
MMMRKLMTPLMILAMAIGFGACSDDKDPAPANENKSIASLYQSLKETPQGFTVNAGSWQSITGARGTIIRFNPQSFKDASGNIITSGTVDITLTEAYTPGQMLLNNVTTETDSHELLGSGGCVNITAKVNNHEVFANNYSISFKQPGANEQSMALFNGIASTDPLSGTIWSSDSSNTVPRATKDSLSNPTFYYAFDSCLNFNWINCDHFISSPDPKSDVKVTLPDSSYNVANTRVFIIFPDLNMVTGLSHYDAATSTFSLGYPSYFLPVGTNIKVVVLSARNNAYYFDLKENITVSNNISITTNPAMQQSVSAIQSVLLNL